MELTSHPAQWLNIPHEVLSLTFSGLKLPSVPIKVSVIQSPAGPEGFLSALLQPIFGSNSFQYLKVGRYSPTVLLQDIMLATFPTQLAERRELHRAEMAELSK